VIEHHDRNYIDGILRLLAWLFQAESIFLWTGHRGTQHPALWPVTDAWDSLTGGSG
jgi:hypothetical protein